MEILDICINCKFHRYIYGNNRKEIVAFPVNRELDYKDRRCLKGRSVPELAEECKDYENWENEQKRKKSSRKRKK